jgi:hypothetical protein
MIYKKDIYDCYDFSDINICWVYFVTYKVYFEIVDLQMENRMKNPMWMNKDFRVYLN